MISLPRRLLQLHLRSRQAPGALVLIAAIAVALRACQPWTRGVGVMPRMLALLLTVAAAAVIATSSHSPFGEPERVSHPLPRLRLTHVLALLAVAVAALGLAHSDHPGIVVRNVAGLTGIALLTATITGGHLAWTAPLGYVVLCGGAMDLREESLWTWPALAANNHTAIVIAVVLLAAGITAITMAGARDHLHGAP
jgi:hypothetical protein